MNLATRRCQNYPGQGEGQCCLKSRPDSTSQFFGTAVSTHAIYYLPSSLWKDALIEFLKLVSGLECDGHAVRHSHIQICLGPKEKAEKSLW